MTTTDADRAIVISRLVRAPVDRVYEVFTRSEHLDRWWGPEGFTTTTRSFDFREGGAWDYVMHGPAGPDSREWDNWIGYRSIEPRQRIGYLHGERADDPQAFEGSISFEERDGGTEVTLRTLFATKEQRDFVVREVNAIEGGEQTLARMAAYVEGESGG